LNATTEATVTQQEYDQLSQRLSTRASTEHFARTAFMMVAAIVVAGTAGKLFWDTAERFLWIPIVPTVISLALAYYAVRRYLAGKRELQRELHEYQRLSSLRQALKLDDPDALLPR